MKNTILFAALIATCGLTFSQVRFIDAPYPNPVSRPAAIQTSVAQQAGLPMQAIQAAAPAMQAGFEATPADANLRKALVRWTKMIGWTFEPEHWTLDRDIPIAGSASLGSDFKMATRLLLSSTEMTDLPAQPCFYSNNVLRVIPLNELCSRQQTNKTP